uniref:Reverse transcriptase zinc-binding domain-containing protein n=1 Tax=Kalanchoe fedtschenkoi TaxID=63787 RepID=A0A7N1A7X2_KALFE
MCVLCTNVAESKEHLFFECFLSKEIIKFLLNSVEVQSKGFLFSEVTNLKNGVLAGASQCKVAGKAAINLAIYSIWKERNARILRGEEKSIEAIKMEVDSTLKMMLAKINTMELTHKNIQWAIAMGISPEFKRKESDATQTLATMQPIHSQRRSA